MMKKGISWIILIISPWMVAAQMDSARIDRNREDITYYHLEDPHVFHSVDTSLGDFFEYNPVYRAKGFHQYLGNIGLPHYPLAFYPESHTGFNPGFHQYDLYLTNPEEARFLNPPFPFTYLRYVQGLTREQILEVAHSQNIGGRFNFGINYELISSEGAYDRQQTSIDDLLLYGRYTSRKWPLDIIGGYILNDVDHENNGGLNTSDQEILESSSFDINPFNLESSTVQTNFNRKYAFLQTDYYFGQKTEQKREENDSVINYNFFPRWKVTYRFNWTQETFEYSDNGPSGEYYPEFLLSRDSTFDRTADNAYINRFHISWLGRKFSDDPDSVILSLFQAKAGIKHEYHRIYQQGRFFPLQNLILEGEIHTTADTSRNFHWGAQGSFVTAGREAGDHDIKGWLSYTLFNQGINIQITGHQRLYGPSLIAEHYLSNHFYWEKKWKNQGVQMLEAALHVTGWQLEVSTRLMNLHNHIYFDRNSLPAQDEGSFRVWQGEIRHQLNLGSFHLINHFLFQQVPEDAPIRFPEVLSRHQFYYQGNWFDNVMFVQLGLAVRYNNPYYADQFNPVNGRFYIQDDWWITRYPEIDAFIQFKVRTARFFFKVAHANAGLLSPQTYFTAPLYPMRGRNFVFGIDWMLFD